MNQINFDFPEALQEVVYTEFCNLSLPEKLVVYAKVVHGTAFKPVNDDLLGLDRKLTAQYYQDFIDKIRTNINAQKSNQT